MLGVSVFTRLAIILDSIFKWRSCMIGARVRVRVRAVRGEQKNPRMAENFDPIFTRARVELTPSDRNALMVLKNVGSEDFKEFDYVNPDFMPIVDPPFIT